MLTESLLMWKKKKKMVIFKSKKSNFDGTVKLKIHRKRLYSTHTVKHLGIMIDKNLNWKYQINDVSVKSNRANAIFYKIKKYVSVKILRSILGYSILIWTKPDFCWSRIQIKSSA